jgi:hypothetical protein
MVGAVPWYFDVVQGPIRMVGGFWQIPDAPGLGIEVNESQCEKHPFAPEVIHTQTHLSSLIAAVRQRASARVNTRHELLAGRLLFEVAAEIPGHLLHRVELRKRE